MRLRRCIGFAATLAITGPSCVDPVHDEQVAALGPEAPGVRTGPDHRPGQPCLACHGGSGPSDKQFSVAGTVYATKGQPAPQQDAVVHLIDSVGSRQTARTNRAGNFYLTTKEWSPRAPFWVTVSYGDTVQEMQTQIGIDGSCGSCHFDPPGKASFGRVYIVDPSAPPAGAP